MIKFVTGDMFKTKCIAVINPCNCRGVAGRGISLYLKKMAPINYNKYNSVCKMGLLIPGRCAVVETDELSEYVKYIINFPTKDDWKEPSKIEYIRSGLGDLVSAMRDFDIKSVAMPAIGCGCGGLEWSRVKTTIVEILEFLGHDGLTFEIYEPSK